LAKLALVRAATATSGWVGTPSAGIRAVVTSAHPLAGDRHFFRFISQVIQRVHELGGPAIEFGNPADHASRSG
jgi:hypothetical protein